jgi:hypothetical protein
MNHFVTVLLEGDLIYDISDVEQVPAVGDQLDLREIDPCPGLYTVVGRTWDLAGRSCELDVELLTLDPTNEHA